MVTLLSSAINSKESLENDVQFNDLGKRLSAAEEAFSTAEIIREKASQDMVHLEGIYSNVQTALETTMSEVLEEWREGAVLAEALFTTKAEMDRLEQDEVAAIDAEKTAALVLASTHEAQRNAISNVDRA